MIRNLQQRELLPDFTAFPINPRVLAECIGNHSAAKVRFFLHSAMPIGAIRVKRLPLSINSDALTPRIEQLTELTPTLEAAFARLLPQLSPRLGSPDAEHLRRVATSPSTALFAAWIDERIVGVLTLVWYDVPSARKAWVEDVVVDASVRGCGVGEALTRAALAHASAIGAEKVSLTSAPHRTAAHALYRKVGFEMVATTVFAYTIKSK